MGSKDTGASHEVTRLLLAWREGDEGALAKLTPLVHQELRRLARLYMTGQKRGHTLQTTALVNEAYLRLVDSHRVGWQNRAHLIAVSAQLMRRILVDFARAKGARKRGGGAQRITLDEAMVATPERGEDLVALDTALLALEAVEPRRSRVVELRFFGGLSVKETAEVLQVSTHTVMRDWQRAKLWLLRELQREESSGL
jgi:RNA polymerase sigma factor (TIGR02999 family)